MSLGICQNVWIWSKTIHWSLDQSSPLNNKTFSCVYLEAFSTIILKCLLWWSGLWCRCRVYQKNKQWCSGTHPHFPLSSDQHTSVEWQKWPHWNLPQPQLCLDVAKALYYVWLVVFVPFLALIPNSMKTLNVVAYSWATFLFVHGTLSVTLMCPNSTIFVLESSVNWGLGVHICVLLFGNETV